MLCACFGEEASQKTSKQRVCKMTNSYQKSDALVAGDD